MTSYFSGASVYTTTSSDLVAGRCVPVTSAVPVAQENTEHKSSAVKIRWKMDFMVSLLDNQATAIPSFAICPAYGQPARLSTSTISCHAKNVRSAWAVSVAHVTAETAAALGTAWGSAVNPCSNRQETPDVRPDSCRKGQMIRSEKVHAVSLRSRPAA